MQATATNIADLSDIATQVLNFAGDEKTFLFFGDMGAGKTTFIKQICKQLDVVDAASSPTYSIVNEYTTQDGLPVYHFDFYRLKAESEAINLGLDEYLYSGSYCLIEWPEKISSHWPEHYIKIEFDIKNASERIITAEIIRK